MRHKKRNCWKGNNYIKKALQNMQGLLFLMLLICFNDLGYKTFIILSGKQ